MALSQGKKIESRSGKDFGFPAKAAAVFHQGALVMLKAGVLEPARPGAGADVAARAAEAALCAVPGIAAKSLKGGTADGDVKVPVSAGVFLFKNSAGADEVRLADYGDDVFVVDDETVAKTSASNTRPKAGVVVDVESVGVWVSVGVATQGA